MDDGRIVSLHAEAYRWKLNVNKEKSGILIQSASRPAYFMTFSEFSSAMAMVHKTGFHEHNGSFILATTDNGFEIRTEGYPRKLSENPLGLIDIQDTNTTWVIKKFKDIEKPQPCVYGTYSGTPDDPNRVCNTCPQGNITTHLGAEKASSCVGECLQTMERCKMVSNAYLMQYRMELLATRGLRFNKARTT